MEKSSFFNAVETSSGVYDRNYFAEDFASFFNSLITNGVFPNPSTNLQIISNDDMTTTVKVGKAWINGYVYINDSDLILPIEVADGILNRIDRLVVRFDTVGRLISTVVKKGTFASSPVAPVLVRDADFYELGIADIYIVNGATSIMQGDITDLRMNTTYCGWVNSLIQADTTSIFNQYQDWFTTQSGTYNDEMIASETQFETDFNTWFTDVKEVLGVDVAANLLVKIDDNTAALATHSADYMPHDDKMNSYASSIDVNGIYTVVDFKRVDATLYLKSTVSNIDVSGNYQTVTWLFYDAAGTTIKLTLVWTLTYNIDNLIITKVVA